MIVSGSQSLDVSRPGLPGINQLCPPPRKGRLPELTGEKIADKTRKSPVPIGKRMNGDKAVTEPHRDFVGRIGVLDRVRIRLVDTSRKNARVADYKVNEDVSGWSSDRAGGNLSNVAATRMNVTLNYTDKWRALTAEQQAAFRKALAIGWTSETDDLSVDHLQIRSQRTYVSNGYGVKKSVYE